MVVVSVRECQVSSEEVGVGVGVGVAHCCNVIEAGKSSPLAEESIEGSYRGLPTTPDPARIGTLALNCHEEH